jgi:hypothetical protein
MRAEWSPGLGNPQPLHLSILDSAFLFCFFCIGTRLSTCFPTFILMIFWPFFQTKLHFMYIPTGHSTRVPYMYKVCTIS